MIGVEAGGKGNNLGEHAARFNKAGGGKIGVLQGTKSYLLQNDDGQIALTHSISAGLDYASVGPEHAFLQSIGRVEYASATDDEALKAFQILSQTEGIIPALESSHAIAHLLKLAPEMSPSQALFPGAATRMSIRCRRCWRKVKSGRINSCRKCRAVSSKSKAAG